MIRENNNIDEKNEIFMVLWTIKGRFMNEKSKILIFISIYSNRLQDAFPRRQSSTTLLWTENDLSTSQDVIGVYLSASSSTEVSSSISPS